MCGIFGFIADVSNQIDQSMLTRCYRSVDLLKYRGPDGGYSWHSKNCFLGFRHLSFFEKNFSTQPLHNENDTIHLICNGEIFNHVELRKRLKKHYFTSISDCEVLIHLYEEYGEDFLQHIKGQFALILWDEISRCVILARDRFGICPLYYLKTASGYFFASEIKALLEYSDKRISLDIEGIAQTLFFYGPEYPKTCFTDIYQVPAGSYLKLNIKTKKLFVKSYWQLQFAHKKGFKKLKRREVLNQFNFLLTQAVKRRLQGDFKPGVYASGGLDSSSIATVMSELKQKTKLFSIQFSDQVYDESFYQTLLSQQLELGLGQLIISDQDILDNLIKTIFHTECPLNRTAPIPMFLLSKLTCEQGYKCILSGEGADELLAGYPVFQKHQPSIVAKFKTFERILSLFADSKHLMVLIKNSLDKYQSQLKSKGGNLHNSQIVEVGTKLSRYLLATQGDRVSMANGIEQRFPFLDEDLVDFIESLSNFWFMSDHKGKVILREAMRDRVPEKIIQRPKKGYLSPDRILAESYRNNNALLREILSLDKIKEAGIFDINEVKRLTAFINNNGALDQNTNTTFIFFTTTQILHELFIKKSKF